VKVLQSKGGRDAGSQVAASFEANSRIIEQYKQAHQHAAMSKGLQELQVGTSERFAAGAGHSQHPFSELTCDCFVWSSAAESRCNGLQAAYKRTDWDACSRLVPAIKVLLRCATLPLTLPVLLPLDTDVLVM
jgi:hypothetical protein